MIERDLSDKVKKNLLDLHFSKHIQSQNTSIILLFTFFIGLIIAFITIQIDPRNLKQLFIVSVITILFGSILSILISTSRVHQRRIISEIKKLDL
ncbi:hypothetical protein ACFLZX_02950 [Nanoarchaeota archaeon]